MVSEVTIAGVISFRFWWCIQCAYVPRQLLRWRAGEVCSPVWQGSVQVPGVDFGQVLAYGGVVVVVVVVVENKIFTVVELPQRTHCEQPFACRFRREEYVVVAVRCAVVVVVNVCWYQYRSTTGSTRGKYFRCCVDVEAVELLLFVFVDFFRRVEQLPRLSGDRFCDTDCF